MRDIHWARVFVLLVVAMGMVSAGLATELVSVSSTGVQGNGVSASAAASADGRCVAFRSAAANLVAGDSNGYADIFVRDRQTGVTERVSLTASGGQGNGDCFYCALSGDGRYVAFESRASNLVAGDANGRIDIFVYDRQADTIERVSVSTTGRQANRDCYRPVLSGDGRYVAFYTKASNLVSGDTNTVSDVFVRDRTLGTTERVSVSSSGAAGKKDSFRPAISADGRYVAFYSRAANLVSGDSNGQPDIFVHDRTAGSTQRVSVTASGGQANSGSYDPAISGDGRYVVFRSSASNLVAGDSNGVGDVFLRDRTVGTTERVSVGAGGAQANAECSEPALSADGRYVAFHSSASTLAAGDGNGVADVFVRDRTLGATSRVSLSPAGGSADGGSYSASMSGNGQVVAFESDARNLVTGDGNLVRDVFAAGLGAPTVTAVSPAAGASNVLPEAVVTATFSEPMNAATITTGTFTLTGAASGGVTGTVSYDAGTRTATLQPASPLAEDRYTATVAGGAAGVKDETGVALAQDYQWTFTVPDRTPPTVTGASPTPGATDVPADTLVTATFSEPMTAGSISTSTFTLTGASGGPVTGTVSYDSGTRTATFQPAAALGPDTYAATVRGGPAGVKDAAGVALEQDYQWTFTVPQVNPPPMTVSITSPDAGATVRGVVTVAAEASGPSGIDRVELFADGLLLATATSAPYQTSWDTRPAAVAEGGHLLAAKAWSPGGEYVQAAVPVTVDNTTFDDVPKTASIWLYVEAMAREGISSGCSRTPPLYCPTSPVTRGQMAVFIVRAAGLTPYANPTPTFADVPPTSSQYPYVEAMYQAGITSGCATDPLRYCPTSSVTRGQMAVFMVRAFGIPLEP